MTTPRAGNCLGPMAHQPLTAEEVLERLAFARTRKEQLIGLNGGDLRGADPHYRQQLVQEFFFHLGGAIDVLAQLVNEARNLGLEDAASPTISCATSRTPSSSGFAARSRTTAGFTSRGGPGCPASCSSAWPWGTISSTS
jgi:hypothetical protein